LSKLDFLLRHIYETPFINAVNMKNKLFEKIDDYIGDLFAIEDPVLQSIEKSLEIANIPQQNIIKAGMQMKVEIRIGEALDVLSQLNDEQTETFDIVFLDAHKPSYIQYLEWALSHTKIGSMIIADNVIRNGEVLKKNSTDEKVIGVQKFNKMLSENKRVFSTIITHASGNGFDGMSISVV